MRIIDVEDSGRVSLSLSLFYLYIFSVMFTQIDFFILWFFYYYCAYLSDYYEFFDEFLWDYSIA